jgi:hypothetical protein
VLVENTGNAPAVQALQRTLFLPLHWLHLADRIE